VGVLAGVDSKDKVTSESKGKSVKIIPNFLDAKSLQGKKVGVERKYKVKISLCMLCNKRRLI
jgi:amidase